MDSHFIQHGLSPSNRSLPSSSSSLSSPSVQTTNSNPSITSPPDVGVEYHPIACIRCRKLHKKCDKKLGGCSKCLSGGVECVYNNPQKRGKGADMYAAKIKDQPSSKKKKTESQPPSTTTTNSLLTPNHLIELYFTFLCGIHPMIEKEKLKYFVNNCLSQFENRSDLHFENNIWIKSIEEMRCIYAFYLGISIMGFNMVADLQSADLYLKKAELEIALLSVDHSTEFYWAAACHAIFLNYISDGDPYKTGYYQSKVEYYLKSQKDKNNSKFFKVMEFHVALVSAKFLREVNTFQSLLQGMDDMFFYYTNKKIADVLLPGVWEYCISGAKLSPQNFILFKQVSEFIFKTLGSYKMQTMKGLTDCHSEGFFKSQRLHSFFVTEGFSMMLMKQIPELSFSILEELTLRITLLTENEVFPFVLLGIVAIVAEACEFHLDVCKQIERGLKPRKATVLTSSGRVISFDYFSILEKDLKALNTLALRYKRVVRSHGRLITEIAQLLERNKNLDLSLPLTVSEKMLAPVQIPQQDEVLARQLEEQAKTKPEDSMSFISDQSLGPWEELFN